MSHQIRKLSHLKYMIILVQAAAWTSSILYRSIQMSGILTKIDDCPIGLLEPIGNTRV